MNFNQLKYFVTIANLGTYSAAAKQLYISQPALSKSIKNMEKELGTTLFVKIDKKNVLTDTGKIFFERAEKLLKEYNEAINAVNSVSELQQGVLHIGVPYGVGKMLLDSIISQFTRKYPYIKIQISGGGSDLIKEMVSSGKLDLGATIIPPEIDSIFEVNRISGDKFFLIVNQSNILAKKENIDFSDLKNEEFIMLNDEFATTQMTRLKCEEAGFTPKIKMYTDRSDFILEMVEKNQGIAVIAGDRNRFEDNSNLVLKDLSKEKKDFDIVLINKKDSYLSYTAKCFIDFCNSVII